MKNARLGSISTGTLRPEGLLSAYARELESLILINGEYFANPDYFDASDQFTNLHGEALDCFAEDGEAIEEGKEDAALSIIESLENALQYFAPLYCYFGAHPGDAADFGFWPDHDAIDELPRVESLDEAKELGEDCAFVNDHGNVTVFGGDGSVILDIV